MATNVIDVENTEVSAVQSRSVELAAPIVEPCIVSADDYTVSVEKQEYSIVGDALYASVSADDAPQWLLSIIDSVLAVNLANGLADLTEARTSILAALSEIDVAKNQYAELINIDVTIDGIIASRLATLNATVAANRADVVNLEITKVTAAEALVIAADRVTAEIKGGAIRGELNRVDTSVATVAGSLAATTLVLEAAYENNATSISTLENTVSANDTGAQARFAYNSVIKLNANYYRSGFGLDSVATSGLGTEVDPYTSSFWINAEKFKFTNSAQSGQVAPFTIDASGVTPQVTFNGVVSFNNVSDAPSSTSGTVNPTSTSEPVNSTYINTTDSSLWTYTLVGWVPGGDPNALTAEDLSATGTTVIDGGRITTGTLDASQVNVANLDAGAITSGVIYNTGGTASTYSMMIDLNNGRIHIR